MERSKTQHPDPSLLWNKAHQDEWERSWAPSRGQLHVPSHLTLRSSSESHFPSDGSGKHVHGPKTYLSSGGPLCIGSSPLRRVLRMEGNDNWDNFGVCYSTGDWNSQYFPYEKSLPPAIFIRHIASLWAVWLETAVYRVSMGLTKLVNSRTSFPSRAFTTCLLIL